MKTKVWLLRIILAGQLLIISLLTGCALLPSSSKTPDNGGTVPQSESTNPGIIHFPEVNSKEWVASISNLCLLVEQSYIGVENHSEPIAEELLGILDRIGVKTTIGENADCEAILRVKVDMTPVGEAVGGAGTCYFEASAEGEATISAARKQDLTLALIYQKPARQGSGITFVYSCPSKEEASFDAAWGSALIPMLGEWWGAPALVSALRSENDAISNGATSELVEMGLEPSGTLPVLVEMLKDVDPNAREAGARTLGEFGPEAAGAVPALINVIHDPDGSVQLEVIRALGKIGDSLAIPILVDTLHEYESNSFEDAIMRRNIIEALGGMGENAVPVIPELIKALKDEDYRVSGEAAISLGKIGPKAIEAVPALIELLESGNSLSYDEAAEALERITGQKFGEDALAWQQWWNSRK